MGKYEAQAKYDKTHTRAFCLKFNKKTDADVIAVLEAVSNKQGYIKQLIRKDIKERS